MMIFVRFLTFLHLLQQVFSLSDVVDLKGDADFRSITLNWKAKKSIPDPYGLFITYCEDQAWGKYRCKEKNIPNVFDKEIKQLENTNFRFFKVDIDGLRMATNYTVDVSTVPHGQSNPTPQRARSMENHLIIQTKGFYARAINCLANNSLVEIETGPHFGGKISVEGSVDPRCATQGNFSATQTSYLLSIDHHLCGSEMHNTSVKTFIIVQENLPILTHSTRRFMVVCNYVPETFTVRAGVNLPDEGEGPSNDIIPVRNDIHEVDPSELFDSTNSLFNSRVSKQVGRALKYSADKEQEEPQKWAHLVLMIILVMAAVIGLSCAVLHIARHSRKKNRRGFMSPQVEPSAIEINGNLEAVVRDFGEVSNRGDHPSALQQPQVALTGIDSDFGFDNGICIISSGQIEDSYRQTERPILIDSNDALIPVDQIGVLPFDLMINDTYNDNQFDQLVGEGCLINSYANLRMNPASDLSGMPIFIPGDHCFSVPIDNLENIDAIFDDDRNSLGSRNILVPPLNFDPLYVNNFDPLYVNNFDNIQNINASHVQEFEAYSDLCNNSDNYALDSSDESYSDTSEEDLPLFNSAVVSVNTYNSAGNNISSEATSSETEAEESNTEAYTENNGSSRPNLKSRCSSVNSIGGIETNWQLRDDDGTVFPATSV